MHVDKTESQIYISPRCRWIYEFVDASLLAQSTGISLPIAQALFKRGIDSPEKLQDFFDTPLTSLINPFTMKNMEAGTDRIIRALKSGESIYIYGDYDVDGVTSTSLLYLFFKELGARVHYYIPNRLEEGYGLNADAIREIASKKANLIITVDCGISACSEVELVKELGLDIVVTDHHQPGETVPDCIVINPMQVDDEYEFKSLAGVGVAFKLCMAVRHLLRKDSSFKTELPNLKKYLGIVALGTIADVVPLVSENRTFVHHGLKILSETGFRHGIDELKKIAGLGKKVTASQVGYALAPRINAVGRMGNSGRGFKLLVTDDRNEARRLAIELEQENKYRQNIERDILEQVYSMIDEGDLHNKYSGLVLYADDWHHGVLGIVASRIADKYFRPTIVLSRDHDILKGSARSIPGFHLYDGLRELSDILISFGGHKYAAGLKLEQSDLPALRSRFDGLVKASLTDEDYIPNIYIDAIVDAKDINDRFMAALSSFEPYGSANKEPVFCMCHVEKYQPAAFVGKDKQHAKCVFFKDGVMFDSIGYDMKVYESLLSTADYFDIVFSLSYNTYGRTTKLQLVLKDIRESE